MESPIRKMLKKNDYARHKLFRKIKRRRLSEIKKQSKAAEKELKRRLRWTAPKLTEGKDPESTSANVHKTNDGYYATYGTDPARWPLTVKESNDDWLQQTYTDELGRVYNPLVQAYTPSTPQAEITADNRSFANNNPLWNYASKLGRQLGDPNKYGVVGGEYILPAIGLAGLLGSTEAAATLGKGITTAMANPWVQGAFAADAGYRQVFTDEGWRKTAKAIQEGRTLDAIKSGAGDVLDLTMMAPMLYKGTKGAYDLSKQGWNWANRNYVQPYRLYNEIGKTSPVLEELNPITRTRLGDVEIDNPQLYYRHGEGITDDFINTGTVKTLPNTHFEYPMFNKGEMWAPIRMKGNPKFTYNRDWRGTRKQDLLVTNSENMWPADVDSLPVLLGGEWLLDEATNAVKHPRVPYPINDLNPANTSAYTWEPNYGYRKVTAEPEVSTIDFNTARTAQELPIKKQVMPPVWLRENLPGYMIKSLSADSKLGKLVSKQGTISLKNVEAWANKSDTPAIDKELLGKVLEAHKGEKNIDYNQLRREVYELIPLYSRVPLTEYENYGLDRLGFSPEFKTNPLESLTLQLLELLSDYLKLYNVGEIRNGLMFNPRTNTYFDRNDVIEYLEDAGIRPIDEGLKLNTFTFESPGIAGNTKHYQGNPIGHSRTYTTKDEPDVLHVMESLSDWALQAHKGKQKPALLNEIVFNEETGLFENPNPIEFLKYSPIESRMIDTYAQRLILENLKYAAENGLTKMRYPTSETAAKIEGYLMKELENPEYTKAREDVYRNAIINLSKKAEDAGYNDFSKVLQNKDIINYFAEYESFPLTFYDLYRNTLDKILKDPKLNIEEFENSVDKQIKQLENNINRYSLQYSPQHQTILKKYADFPKLYLKLFGKETNVRTVTDSKGNTWYEVDVPQNYLDGTAEMLFDKGKDLRLPKFTFIQPIYNRK